MLNFSNKKINEIYKKFKIIKEAWITHENIIENQNILNCRISETRKICNVVQSEVILSIIIYV